jgi:hypothetical protein
MAGVQFVVDEEKKAGTVSASFDTKPMLQLDPLAQGQKELGIAAKA